MSVKLLTDYHLEFLSLKEHAHAHLCLHMSKCHIVGNLMSRLICALSTYFIPAIFILYQTRTISEYLKYKKIPYGPRCKKTCLQGL